jgi:chitinase
VRVAPFVIVAVLGLASCTSSPPPPAVTTPVSAERVVGYFTDWGVYGRNFQVKDIHAGKLTDLVYAFGKVDDGQCSAADAWADYQKPIAAPDSVDGSADSGGLQGNFGQLRKLKAAHPQLRVIWSFGGWTGSHGFTDAAVDPARFAASCAALLNDKQWSGVFDGIDVDWEYPNGCGLDCDASGSDALAKLLSALRAALGPKALVTAAVPGDVGKLDKTDYATAAKSADWLSAMTYDYFGTSADGGGAGGGESAGPVGPTAPHAPLTAYPGIPNERATADAAVTKLLSLGVPPAKVLLGVGFYGRGWTGVTAAGPGGTASAPADGTYEKGVEDYRVLRAKCPPTGVAGGTAYAHCGTEWWGYDTPQTIKTKMEYAQSKGLGGAFAWELSGDTESADLLTAMADGLS